MKPKARWKQYQVSNGKSVAELTQEEAKDELCLTIALLDKLRALLEKSREAMRNWAGW